jgi:ceramide glucosyltransferase
MAGIGWGLLGGYVVVSAVRHVLARRAWQPSAEGPEPEVVVLQPILSGDPFLAEQLAANLANHPAARFRWLVDEGDDEGRRVATALAEGVERVEVRVYGEAPASANPKVYKLARAVDASDSLVAVLDDDTVLPPGTLACAATLLADADLVTGVPYYLVEGSLWSRLVAAFVNGSALITYLPLSLVGPPVSINGMFYLTTRAALERAGGFAAMEDRVCDDYELAALYRRAGLLLVQASLPHPLRTTVTSAAAYASIMRRWLVFSLRLLRDEANPSLAALVVAPGVAPGVAIACAVAARRPTLAAASLAAVAAKAVATARLRRDLLGAPSAPGDLGCEVVSDLLLPVHLLAALAARGHITWRGRPMRIGRDGRVAP